jgi:hypothetical protein
MASRENADGSMTYWQDGADEPAKVSSGRAEKVAEPEAETKVVEEPQAKVVESPEPKKASGRSRAQSK